MSETNSSDRERPDPEEDPFACSICGAPLGTVKRVRGADYCDGCLRDAGVLPPADERNDRHRDTGNDRPGGSA